MACSRVRLSKTSILLVSFLVSGACGDKLMLCLVCLQASSLARDATSPPFTAGAGAFSTNPPSPIEPAAKVKIELSPGDVRAAMEAAAAGQNFQHVPVSMSGVLPCLH